MLAASKSMRGRVNSPLRGRIFLQKKFSLYGRTIRVVVLHASHPAKRRRASEHCSAVPQITPWPIIASATFTNPATLAPFT